ncbi:MAG: hypothetical protein ACOYXS_05880 [Chloroflexota bacterium]
MRKLATLSALVFALSLAGSQAVLAASPSPSPSAPPKMTTPPTKVAVPASHHWKTTFTSGKAHDSARLTVASTYNSGALYVNLSGLKKGDRISVALIAQGKVAGKPVVRTLVSRHRTVTAASGKLAFSFRLSRAQARAIEAALKAGDTLALRFSDGPMTATGTFVRS